MTSEDGEPQGRAATSRKQRSCSTCISIAYTTSVCECSGCRTRRRKRRRRRSETRWPLRDSLAAASFDVRLFSAALDALEPRLKLRHPSSIGSNPLFHQVDVDRLGDATRAPSAQETAGLIWETVSRLDPADYVLLDLRFRQDFDEAGPGGDPEHERTRREVAAVEACSSRSSRSCRRSSSAGAAAATATGCGARCWACRSRRRAAR